MFMVEYPLSAGVDHDRVFVQLVPDRQGRQASQSRHAAQDVRAAAVDIGHVGHVTVIAGVRPQSGQRDVNKGVLLGVSGEVIVLLFRADGSWNLTAAHRSRGTEGAAAMGGVYLD